MSLWPFARSKPQAGTSSVEELGALVQQGGHQIVHELTSLAEGQREMSSQIGRLAANTAGNSTDIRDLTSMLGTLIDRVDETNRLVAEVIESMPLERRPTPLPPPPLARLPRPPNVPNIRR